MNILFFELWVPFLFLLGVLASRAWGRVSVACFARRACVACRVAFVCCACCSLSCVAFGLVCVLRVRVGLACCLRLRVALLLCVWFSRVACFASAPRGAACLLFVVSRAASAPMGADYRHFPFSAIAQGSSDVACAQKQTSFAHGRFSRSSSDFIDGVSSRLLLRSRSG